jgi:hypothetical protein
MRDLEALTAAMATVPLLYSRNRLFTLFKDPIVRRARVRARLVRGLVRFIGRKDAEVDLASTDPPKAGRRDGDASVDRVQLGYRIPRLRLSRSVTLTDFELALLRTLLAIGPHPAALALLPDDRARVDAALARLPKEAVPYAS